MNKVHIDTVDTDSLSVSEKGHKKRTGQILTGPYKYVISVG